MTIYDERKQDCHESKTVSYEMYLHTVQHSEWLVMVDHPLYERSV